MESETSILRTFVSSLSASSFFHRPIMITDSATTAPPRHSRGSSNNVKSVAMALEHAVAASGRRGVWILFLPCVSVLTSSSCILGADILERRTAPGASFDSGTKYDPPSPKCHPRTRTAIFTRIAGCMTRGESVVCCGCMGRIVLGNHRSRKPYPACVPTKGCWQPPFGSTLPKIEGEY